jgi:hypothetical protein
MMRGASGDECGKLLGQYNRSAEAGVLKKPREATFKQTVPILSSKLQHGIASMCNSILYLHDQLITTPSLHITD